MKKIRAALKKVGIIKVAEFYNKAKITPASVTRYTRSGFKGEKAAKLILTNMQEALDFYSSFINELRVHVDQDMVEEFIAQHRKFLIAGNLKKILAEEGRLQISQDTLESLRGYVKGMIAKIEEEEEDTDELFRSFDEEDEEEEQEEEVRIASAPVVKRKKNGKIEKLPGLTASQKLTAFLKAGTDVKRVGNKPTAARRW